ncbi:MAG: efflux RND transporter periplasmic adaptor subunit [Planctomycetes bacterium]|nr:efflux RND transporter periplasmic adaptor subunit [Planctomycetota bacterium]
MSNFTETLKLNLGDNQPPAGPEAEGKNKSRRFYQKPKGLFALAAVVLVLASVGYIIRQNGQNSETETPAPAATAVKTMVVDRDAVYSGTIDAVGAVKAETEVDIVALSPGTVRGIFFAVGDKVGQNEVLAQLKNDTAAIGYANARLSLSNAQTSYETAKLITGRNAEQARLGADTAAKAVAAAEIGVQAARDNLANIGSLQEKSNADIREQAIVVFYDFTNTINSVLDQINFLIQADVSLRDQAKENILGVTNVGTLAAARLAYTLARQDYDRLAVLPVGTATIESDILAAVRGLDLTKRTVDDTITVLNNSITSAAYGEDWLNGQKAALAAVRGNVVNSQNRAKQTRQSLENVALANEQQKDQLVNALQAAENQLAAAQVGYNNALVGLAVAENGGEQQLNAARAAIDSVQGQVSIIGTQVADLTVKSPIRGVVTARYAELGTEVNPGQKIAQVANTDLLKIEVSLPAEQVYRISLGEEVTIRGDLKGRINLIDPAADPITKKVRLEIIFDNSDKALIPGTFTDVAIPTKAAVKAGPDSVFIPLKALLLSQTDGYVYLIADGRARKTNVVPGKTAGELIEILKGLDNGDILIVDGAKEVEDGEAVAISQE